MNTYFLYILKCSDQTLYTGITKNLDRRLNEHNFSPLGAKYTSGRRPVHLVFAKEINSRSEALKEEYNMKRLSRLQKLAIINNNEFLL